MILVIGLMFPLVIGFSFFSDEYMGTHQVVPDVSLFYELRLIYYRRPSKFLKKELV